MHSIKNISERNKMDTLSRADAYIRRNRLISKSDYNINLDAPKSILETEKNPKTLSSGQKTPKTQKKPKNPKKNPKNLKNPKKPLGWFFFKPGFFPTLLSGPLREMRRGSGIPRQHVRRPVWRREGVPAHRRQVWFGKRGVGHRRTAAA